MHQLLHHTQCFVSVLPSLQPLLCPPHWNLTTCKLRSNDTKKNNRTYRITWYEWLTLSLFLYSAGDEGPQVRCVFTGVHPVGQPEEAHAHPQQRPTIPVSRLLQELHSEADPQDAHDCPPACKAIQMQGGWSNLIQVEETFQTCSYFDICL